MEGKARGPQNFYRIGQPLRDAQAEFGGTEHRDSLLGCVFSDAGDRMQLRE